jgi:phage terminase large subunit-like protein
MKSLVVSLAGLPEDDRRRVIAEASDDEVAAAYYKWSEWARPSQLPPHPPTDLVRVVVAIDPAARSTEISNETGIVVAGRDAGGNAWVLADISGRYQPVEWAKAAIAAYRAHHADRIVAEINNGGDMVEATLRMVDPNVPFRAVQASRGKVARAEPVATLYEQGKVRHLGAFPVLEDQMCAFTRDTPWTAGVSPASSPDRVDALVWALSDLLVSPMPQAGIFEYYHQRAGRAAAEQ